MRLLNCLLVITGIASILKELLSEGAKGINFPYQKIKHIKACQELATMIPEAFDDSWNLNICRDKVTTLPWVAKGRRKRHITNVFPALLFTYRRAVVRSVPVEQTALQRPRWGCRRLQACSSFLHLPQLSQLVTKPGSSFVRTLIVPVLY